MFEYIWPNVLRKGTSVQPNDEYTGDQYGVSHIKAHHAWEFTKGNRGNILAILDSGIPIQNNSLSHEDLNDNSRFIKGYDAIGDGNGVKDENGHGSHVAGIASAMTDNSKGIAGIDWESQVYICQVLDEHRNGTADNFYDAVKHAVAYGAKVINYSGGGHDYSPVDRTAIEYAQSKGVLIVASAGNRVGNNEDVYYPARLANEYNNLIAVTSVDQNDKRSIFSNKGNTITLSAPGTSIFSTTPNYAFYENWVQNYSYVSGSSQATPFVLG